MNISWVCQSVLCENHCVHLVFHSSYGFMCVFLSFVSSSLSLQMPRNFVRIIQIVKTRFVHLQHSNSTMFENMSNSCTRPIEYPIFKWYFTTYFISYDHDCATVNENRWTEKNLHLITNLYMSLEILEFASAWITLWCWFYYYSVVWNCAQLMFWYSESLLYYIRNLWSRIQGKE